MTPWTAAYQAPPSMGFSRQEYWSGVPLPSPSHHLGRVKNFYHPESFFLPFPNHPSFRSLEGTIVLISVPESKFYLSVLELLVMKSYSNAFFDDQFFFFFFFILQLGYSPEFYLASKGDSTPSRCETGLTPKERPQSVLPPLFIHFVFSPLSLLCANWASQEGVCLFHLKFALLFMDFLLFIVPFSEAFPFLCLLATTILDPFFDQKF